MLPMIDSSNMVCLVCKGLGPESAISGGIAPAGNQNWVSQYTDLTSRFIGILAPKERFVNRRGGGIS